jgi:hypothetical protein
MRIAGVQLVPIVRRVRWSIYGLMAAALMAAAGCALIDVSETTTNRSAVVTSNVPECSTSRIQLTTPTVGLFVGISDYSDARIASTPAHTLGAAMMYSTFFDASRKHEIPEATNFLEASLRLPVGSAEAEAATRFLQIRTHNEIWAKIRRPSKSDFASSADGKWTYLGDGKLVTRAKLNQDISAAITMAERVYQANGSVLLVLYVAAHGVRSSSGEYFLQPADARIDDPSTWMSLSELLQPVRRWIEEDLAAQGNKQVLVITDTCQRDTELSSSSSVPQAKALPHWLVVVQSASPGQYAWHFPSSAQSRETVRSDKTHFGIVPGISDEKSGTFVREFRSRMSLFPLALQCGLAFARQTYDNSPKFQGESAMIGNDDLISITEESLKELLTKIPTATRGGFAQDLAVIGVNAGDTPYFLIEPKSESPKGTAP